MAYVFRDSMRCCSLQELEKVNQLMERYGIDPWEDATLLGYGGFKEAHASERYPGTAVIITTDWHYFYNELEALKQIAGVGLPVIEYYTYMEIGPYIIALAKRYNAPNAKWDEERFGQLKEKVKKYLKQLSRGGFITDDLQYMIDENDQPIFNDPLNIYPTNSACIEMLTDTDICITASCKHQGSSPRFDVVTWVELKK